MRRVVLDRVQRVGNVVPISPDWSCPGVMTFQTSVQGARKVLRFHADGYHQSGRSFIRSQRATRRSLVLHELSTSIQCAHEN